MNNLFRPSGDSSDRCKWSRVSVTIRPPEVYKTTALPTWANSAQRNPGSLYRWTGSWRPDCGYYASGASPGSITTLQITENVVPYVPFISTDGARLQSIPSPVLEQTRYRRGYPMWIGTIALGHVSLLIRFLPPYRYLYGRSILSLPSIHQHLI